jgi:hypothetical protein
VHDHARLCGVCGVVRGMGVVAGHGQEGRGIRSQGTATREKGIRVRSDGAENTKARSNLRRGPADLLAAGKCECACCCGWRCGYDSLQHRCRCCCCCSGCKPWAAGKCTAVVACCNRLWITTPGLLLW